MSTEPRIGRRRTAARVARWRALVPLLAGVLLLLLTTLAGWSEWLLGVLVSPPGAARFLLGTAALLLGVVLVLRAADSLGRAQDPRGLVRAVRIVFLAVGALAAAGGWFVASPLPIVAGLLIAGIDVVETSFLLLVTTARRAPGD